MGKKNRPKVNAKKWADKPDSGFEDLCFKTDRPAWEPKEEDTYRLEIIPYFVPEKSPNGLNPNAAPGDFHYERTYFQHFGIGPNNQRVVCPKRTANKKCPICDYREKLEKDKEADEELIESLYTKQRQLWNVFDRDAEDKGVQVFEISFHMFGKHLKQAVKVGDEDDGYDFFADPDDGLTLRVYFEQKSFNKNKYYEAKTFNFKDRKGFEITDEILEQAAILDDILTPLPYEELRQLFLQEEPEESNDDEPVTKVTSEKAETKKEPKYGKGDDVRYKGKDATVIKVIDEDTYNIMLEEGDEMVKGVDEDDLGEPKPEGKAEKDKPPFDTEDNDAKDEKKPEEGVEKPKKEEEKEGEKESEEEGDGEDEDWDSWD